MDIIDMDNTIILNIGIVTDKNAVLVSADDCIGPDTTIFSNRHITDYDRRSVHETRFMDPGFHGQNNQFLIINIYDNSYFLLAISQ